jgi:lysophospholipase L1-like esterase
MNQPFRRVFFAFVATIACSVCTPAPSGSDAAWIASWATAQQIPEPRNALPAGALHDATLRQIVRVSVGGPALRVRLSNAFGTEPLHVLAAHVARPLREDTIDPATDHALTFNGRADVVIPAGAEMTSDALAVAIAPLSSLAITVRIEDQPGQQTGHPGSRATSYVATGIPAAAGELRGATSVDHWYFIAGIEVSTPTPASSVVVLGDSITDGHGATTNGNDRWPDVLAERLQRSPTHRTIGMLNAGIGGNRLLLDGLGPNALARFDRDVLGRAGVRHLIVLEGINDLGMLTHDGPVSAQRHEDLVHGMIGVYREMITRAHAHDIKVLGATLLPFGGNDFYHPDAANERDRQALNAWIREPGHFDAVVDFDRILADPQHPDRLNEAYDSGDHLHPSPAGYRKMGESVPLEFLSDR